MKLGIEVLARDPHRARLWGRCALLCNQASVTQSFRGSWEILQEILGDRLVAFFGPQHGFHATVQDNMIETAHAHMGPYGKPIYSLYSETREPQAEMLAQIDTIVIDLQIVGCRVYTFKYTVAACLRAAKKHNKRVVILDRPNPLGGIQVEGRVLQPAAKSFVGEFAIPLRHGLTPAECGLFFNRSISADLECISMEDWDPSTYWTDFYKHWILTSPNLPSPDSVYIYPATVMLEGTNISEGRGTGLPFQFVGAPYIKDGQAYSDRVNSYHKSQAFHLRPAEFQPTSQKWAGEVCRGFQIHVIDPKSLATYALGLAIIKAAIDLAPKDFAWKQPPYEYDFTNLPINLILGHLEAEKKLQSSFSLEDRFWSAGVEEYIADVSGLLIYKRHLIS